MPIGLRGLSVNIHMLAYEQAPRQPYSCFHSDRHLGALSATYKNTGLHPLQKIGFCKPFQKHNYYRLDVNDVA